MGYAIVLQKFHRLQKQVDALVGNEPPNENELFVAGDVRDQPKGGVVIRIADHKRMSADSVGHRFADRDISDKPKQPVFEPIVPTDSAAGVLKPGLVNNEGSFPQEQSRNQTAEADIVLKKQITPAEQANEFRNRW